MVSPFRFNLEKAIEAILYIIENGTENTLHHISKVMYFADKEHIEKYGRFICGDSYVAMKHGPVPSGIYDILKTVRGDFIFNLPDALLQDLHATLEIVDKYRVNNLRTVNLDFFSESDLECLDNSIQRYGHLSFDELTELSHDSAWDNTNTNDFMELEDIISTIDNSEDLLEHLYDPHPGEA